MSKSRAGGIGSRPTWSVRPAVAAMGPRRSRRVRWQCQPTLVRFAGIHVGYTPRRQSRARLLDLDRNVGFFGVVRTAVAAKLTRGIVRIVKITEGPPERRHRRMGFTHGNTDSLAPRTEYQYVTFAAIKFCGRALHYNVILVLAGKLYLPVQLIKVPLAVYVKLISSGVFAADAELYVLIGEGGARQPKGQKDARAC